MAVTPRLGVLMMASNMAAKEQVFNEAILSFDALFSGSVISAAITTPPSSPADGDCYVVPAGATGAWSGKTNKIAFAYNGWQFVTAPTQYRVYNQATSQFIRFNGSTWDVVPAGAPVDLVDLTDVNAASATDGQVLAYDNGSHKWVPLTLPAAITALSSLTDVDVVEGPGIDGKYLSYDDGDGMWKAVSLPAGINTFTGLSDVTITPGAGIDGFLVGYNHGTSKFQAINPSSLAVVATLDQIGDVSYGAGPATNDALIWNGAAWAPSSSAVQFIFENMTNGPGTMVGAAGKVLIVNALETELEYADLAAFISAAGIKLVDLTDVDAVEGPGIDGKFLKFNNSSGKWEAASVASPLAVKDEGTTIDASVSSINFTGTGVTVTPISSGNVRVDVTNPPTLSFKDHGSAVTPTPTTIDFSGNCTVANAAGVLTLTVTGVDTLAALTDADIISPVSGDVLVWNNATSKWENQSLAIAVSLLPNTLSAPTYEFGPYAPPTIVMLPTAVNATGIANQFKTGRGYLSVPGTYGALGYVMMGHSVVANSPPWQTTARVAVNAGAVGGYYGGIAMRRSASNSLAFVGISPNYDGGNTRRITFTYWNGSAETSVASINNQEAQFLRLGFDGTNIKAYYSFDGLLWILLGSVNTATALSGTPDQTGLAHRVVSGVASNVSTLMTYYDDPDYPAGARTSTAYGTLGLGDLTNVSTNTPTDGQYLQWRLADNAWVPTNPPYKVGAFFTTPPASSETLLIHAVVTPVTFKANFSDSHAYVGTNPAASFTMTVKKNGTAIGTININTSGVITFATTGGVSQSAVAGDVLTIEAPSSVDGTIANVAVTLLGS